ncbi:MAG: hypothetical protein ACTSYU_04565 [Promethearchaeota archaeon]
MELWQFYSILFVQVFTGLTAIILAYFIYKQNPKYDGNQYLSLGFLLYSLYPFGCFFYELGICDLCIEISIRVSLFGTILGSLFFLISMNIFCLGSKSESLKKLKLPAGIITILVCVIILLPSSVSSIELHPSTAERSMLLMGAISSFILLSTGRMLYLLTKTIKEIEDKDSQVRKKLLKFRLALFISLGIMFCSIIENVTQIHYFNIFNYLFLLATYIIISQPFLKKKKI